MLGWDVASWEMGKNEMPIRNKRAPTLADVAREARVSLKTASRVLNGASNVRQEKVSKVQAVMARLGYRPNELARSLMTRKSGTIGIIVANLANPFVIEVIKAVQQVARANGYVLIITSSEGQPEVESAEIESLVRRRIDGLIIAPASSGPRLSSHLLPANIPTVTFDQLVRGTDFDSVIITNRQSASEATKHMIAHGYRRIVAVGTRPYLYTSKERVAGYRRSMAQSGLEARECFVKHESLLTAKWLEEEMFRGETAEAIFSLNWVTTQHVLRGLRDLGISAGRDIALISFDDFDLGEMLTPGLSVVQQPSDSLGRESARLLFERLKGDHALPSRRIVLQARLVIRQSCGCGVGGSLVAGPP